MFVVRCWTCLWSPGHLGVNTPCLSENDLWGQVKIGSVLL